MKKKIEDILHKCDVAMVNSPHIVQVWTFVVFVVLFACLVVSVLVLFVHYELLWVLPIIFISPSVYYTYRNWPKE